MSYVLALDPGGTTGWAFGKYMDDEALTFLEGGQIEGGLEGFIEWFQQNSFAVFDASLMQVALHHPELFQTTIVSESFQLRPGVKNPDVTPLRIEGALAVLSPVPVVYQTPATKAMVPDDKLRDNGLWIPGQRHQMDARIHAIAHMLKIQHMPTIEALWPKG